MSETTVTSSPAQKQEVKQLFEDHRRTATESKFVLLGCSVARAMWTTNRLL